MNRDWTSALGDLRLAGRYRRLKRVDRRKGPYLWQGGRRVLSFASNDYLGLAQDPAVVRAMASSAYREGGGAGSSRLLAGHHRVHEALEEGLAGWMGSAAALAYPTGYMANVGVMASLAREGDLVISDELNHASLVDGCRLSRARVLVAPHGGVEWAASRLRRMKGVQRIWVVTESVFSMDGDLAPLRDWHAWSRRVGAWLIVDEAHALGVFGTEGRGLLDHWDLSDDRVIRLGTLSKAFGLAGGVMFGPRQVREWLVNTSRTFMFTTAMPLPVARAALASLGRVRTADPGRKRLWTATRLLQEGIRRLGLDMRNSGSPIVPVVVGSERDTMRLARRLALMGIDAPGVRPPTVPPGTSRLRLTVTANHDSRHIQQLLAGLNVALN